MLYQDLTQVGSQLENIQRQQNIAPAQALQQYSGFVNPIASGFPVQTGTTQTSANPVTTAMGGALIGSKFGSSRCINRWWSRILRGIIIMKIQEHIPHFVKEHKKAIAVAVVILIIAIIL